MLNEALLRQRDDRRFCTVAYAYFEKLDRGARAGVASGGHPLPLLLRADGTVETVGEPGTLLGVVPDPDLEDRAVTLEPGDALVFYTDGVIEGRARLQGVLDERRLAELVATCAGAGADAIAARVEEAAVLSQDGRPRDDIAVLVLRVVDYVKLSDVGLEVAARVHPAGMATQKIAQGRGEAGPGWPPNAALGAVPEAAASARRAISQLQSGPRSAPDRDATPARDGAGHEQRPAHRVPTRSRSAWRSASRPCSPRWPTPDRASTRSA